jgi:dimethylargininase
MIALTHIPSPNMQACERTFVPHAAIDHALAVKQHAAYCWLLADCGVKVVKLDVNANLPDCTFIEDTAIVLGEKAIFAPMGAPSRRLESAAIQSVLQEYCEIARIHLPATIDGGDVLRVGCTLLVGESCRTNAAGIAALKVVVRRYGYQVSPVPVRGCLHLKTACTALPDGRLLVNPNWLDASALAGFELLHVPEEEPWGGNVALVGDKVLLAAAHVQTAELIRRLGFTVRPIDLSEFAKAEGGVTCLSLFIS